MPDQIERHKCCPKCGSKKFKFAKSTTTLVDSGPAAALLPMKDRICKKCGELYHPQMPAIIPYAVILGGVALAMAGVIAFFEPLMSGPTQFAGWVKYVLLASGGVLLFAGVQLLLKKP